MTTIAEADLIAASTEDAYSYDDYIPSEWRRCCRMLARRGYTPEWIEEIMRSKFTRWATTGRGKATHKDLARFLDKENGPTPTTPENIAERLY
jgi:hypothetical protein